MYNISPHQQLRCRNKRKIITENEISPEGNVYDAGNCVIVTWEDDWYAEEVTENEKEQSK